MSSTQHKFLAVMLASVIGLTTFAYQPISSAAPAKAKPAATKMAPKPHVAKTAKQGIVDFTYQDVSPIQLVSAPESYLNKKVSFSADFNSFDGYALDYKGAMKSSKDYVAILVRRPDVTSHKIPLSELKILFPRSLNKLVKDLEPGDKIFVQGKVFSTALGDTWVDVEDIMILQKTKDSKLNKS